MPDTIEAPYDTRTHRMVRKTLDAHEDAKERVAAIIALVDELGLEPPAERSPCRRSRRRTSPW
jgi:hypothetical protein